MKAIFANLTAAEFRGGLQIARRLAERRRIHALFDVIQVAIHSGDSATVDDLMAELAIATRECQLESSRPRSLAE